MDRRRFVKAGLASAFGAALPGQPAPERHFYELRIYELRNDLEPSRIQTFFEEHYVPALRRLGVGPVGAFTPEAGIRRPALILLIDYPTLDQVATVADRLAADPALRSAGRELEAAGRLAYVRYESALYRAFAGHPSIEVPPTDPNRPPRLFELRFYEAPHTVGLAAKVDMFNQEEIRIFRNVGMAPIFFGEAIAGSRLPHLAYIVAFDDMAARTRAWAAFAANPDWQRIRTRPGWTDPEAVSNQQIAFLRPTRFSDVR